MQFKLIITLVEDGKTETVMRVARESGATGSTIINQARGGGSRDTRTFFGLSLQDQRDVLLFIVEEHLARHILERIEEAGEFEQKPGTGIAFQVDVEDAVGISRQVRELRPIVEEQL